MYCSCVNAKSLVMAVDAIVSAASPDAVSTNTRSTIRVRVFIIFDGNPKIALGSGVGCL